MKKAFTTLFFAAGLIAAAFAKDPNPVSITINTEKLSMVMSVNRDGELLFQHFGGKINDSSPFLKKKSYRRADHGTDNMAYSTAGGRNFREAALSVAYPDGDMNTELVYVSHSSGTLADNNVEETVITLRDRKQPFEVDLVYTAYKKENVIVTHAVLKNKGKKDVTLRNFYSSSLPVKSDSYLLTHFYGAWAMENQTAHTLLTHGTKSIESKKGVRTTHTENPSFMVTFDSGHFEENCGEVLAGALAWSGNHKLNFEIDEFNVLNITAGINPHQSEYILGKGRSFTTPDMVYTYSLEGAGQASRNLHDWARNYGMWDSSVYAPTLLNSWEGAYFDFDAGTLTGMIDDAADLGLEMFVLDDGWFGNKYPRDNATAGLGDWEVNSAKLPEGIDYIARYAHEKGIKFGIWIEPEMVNPKSELAERHPDWVVKTEGREATTMRSQWLLDLSNPKVQDYVFGIFDNTMQLSPYISYIKWDANRHVENAGSAYLPKDRQSHFWIDYVQGFYSVMDRIRAKYPDVLIQACASGGGRIEYGALKYFNEAWTSDNTEALSRARIQYGVSLIYPAIIMGSHVSYVPNKQSGNVTPIKFRFDIASAARLGMELQPKTMTDEEKAFARRAIGSYKGYRDIVMYGDLYRIASPYDGNGYYALMYVSKDKTRAVVFAYCLHYQGRVLTPRFRLRGLDETKTYSLTELNADKSGFWGSGGKLDGSFLIHSGINPQLNKLYDSAIYYLEAE